MTMNSLNYIPKKQRGVTLLVAMITLIVLMLLGVGAMVASNTMFKLAGNLQFENEAKNRAESTLTIAENYLLTGANSQNSAFTTPNKATATLPFYDPTATLDPLNSWPAAASSPAGVSGGQFIIQLMSNVKICPPGSNCLAQGSQAVTPPTQYYLFRVTAKGSSMRGAKRFVESIMQVPAP
ncbi:MAG: hypothetical protein WCD45_09205 [Gallionella sp.]